MNNTDEASIIFDFLTYEKGGAVLMQLYKAIGNEIFRNCISSYISKFKWAKTNRNDFIYSFDKTSSKISLIWSNGLMNKLKLKELTFLFL